MVRPDSCDDDNLQLKSVHSSYDGCNSARSLQVPRLPLFFQAWQQKQPGFFKILEWRWHGHS